jgi:hypothetical protein
MADNDDNFLSRWSRRKVAGKQAEPEASKPLDPPRAPVRAELVLRQAQDDRMSEASTSSARTGV